MKKFLMTAALGMLMAAAAFAGLKTDDLTWHDASQFPVLGTLSPDASKAYSRLPDSLENRIRKDVWDLGKNSAGLALRFRSDASSLGFKWRSLNKFNMNHMTAAGIRGLDLYALDGDGKWKTVSSVRPAFNSHSTTAMAVTDMDTVMREYMLYLPLYDGVDSIFVGTNPGAVVEMPAVDSPRRAKPVIMYGTSILQGGCATRPGMVHTSMLERMLDREVINLGFSGNAKLDMEIANLMADADPSIVVLDPLPNCTREMIIEKLPDFYATIRKAHPKVPIVFVESCTFPIMKWNNEVRQTITEKNNALAGLYAGFAASDPNVYYFEGDRILTNREGTVDNYHLTDLGFTDFANNLYPLLEMLLGD